MSHPVLGKISLNLVGGGAAGLRQLGYLKALAKLDIKYDMLQTCSVGTLNGLMLRENALDELENIWLTIKNKDVYSLALWKLFTKDGCFYDSSPLKALLTKIASGKPTLKDGVPWYINTTDWLKEIPYTVEASTASNLIDLCLASCSPPMAFPPVHYEGKLLVDGGLMNNFSISQAVKLGADTIIVLAPRPHLIETQPPKNAADNLTKLIMVPPNSMFQREINFVNILNKLEGYRKVNVISVFPADNYVIDLLDFDGLGSLDKRREIIEVNYQSAKKILAEAIQV